MADKSREYKGGVAEPAGGGKDRSGSYRNFVARQVQPFPHVTLVNVHGQVLVANPGIVARLSKILDENPQILLLRLELVQQPGQWTQLEVPVPAVYVAPLIGDGPFKRCQIINGEVTVVDIPFTY